MPSLTLTKLCSCQASTGGSQNESWQSLQCAHPQAAALPLHFCSPARVLNAKHSHISLVVKYSSTKHACLRGGMFGKGMSHRLLQSGA